MKATRLISGTGRTVTRMGEVPAYEEGLYDTGHDTFAWLVPNGSWGETNVGLVRCGGSTVLIDTCWDLHHTREMLAHADAILQAAPISHLINTHADGDHCWGNQLFPGIPIYSTQACADQLHHHRPRQLSALKLGSRLFSHVPVHGVDALGRYMGAMLRPYDFSGIHVVGATQTFSGQLSVEVEGIRLELMEVGPGHTNGDCIVHVPERRVVFTGDILFVNVTPVAWAGPVSGITGALKRVLEMDVDVIVPGHGPLATRADVQRQIDYWEWLEPSLRTLASHGHKVDEAAQLCLDSKAFRKAPFSRWCAAERIFTSACTLYRAWGLPHARDSGPIGQLDHFRRQALLRVA
ncbi:MAG: MBL fold metallo-hydrolase [Cupriavidus sp.]|nr:MAG: MBL fold metallo-hydrolase [Cupriavidus sp.]